MKPSLTAPADVAFAAGAGAILLGGTALAVWGQAPIPGFSLLEFMGAGLVLGGLCSMFVGVVAWARRRA